MKTDSAKTLPKMLPGVICWQWVRCGRAGCQCAEGNLHGPYAYRFFRQGNRLRKEYVPRAQSSKLPKRAKPAASIIDKSRHRGKIGEIC